MVTKMSEIKTTFSGIDFSKYSSKVSEFVSEFTSRANKQGHFLNWVNLPQEQLKRVDELYEMVENFKKQTNATKLRWLKTSKNKLMLLNLVLWGLVDLNTQLNIC